MKSQIQTKSTAPGKMMNLNDIGTQLLFTTFPVVCENQDGSKGSATGFIYSYEVPDKENVTIPFLVTNYHVVEQANRCFVRFVRSRDAKPIIGENVTVEIDRSQLLKTTDKDNDLAVIPIGPVFNQLQKDDKPVFFRSINPKLIPDEKALSELGAIEEITFVGCPSGIFDDVNSAPLIRRGITASPIWNDFNGKPVFIIDAGVFPGSSGSPVFIYNQGSYATHTGVTIGTRVFFVGIISSTFISGTAGQNKAFLGLGRVIQSRILKRFIDDIVSKIQIP